MADENATVEIQEELQEVLNDQPQEVVEAPVEEQAEPTEQEEKTEPEVKPEPPPKPTAKDRQEQIRAEINRLTWEKHEAARQLEETRRQIEQSKAQMPSAQLPPDAIKKPDPNDFDDHDAYIEALTDYKVQKQMSDYRREEQKRQQQQNAQYHQQVVANQWSERKQKAVLANADFLTHEDNVRKVVETYQNPALAQAIIESDQGVDVVTYLGNHAEEAERIAKLPPMSAIKELGKLEMRLTAKPKATQTPPPITPTNAGGSAREPDISRMTAKEYITYMNKKEGLIK